MGSYYERLNEIMDEWAVKSGSPAIDVDQASDYALKNKLFGRVPMTLKQLCMRDMRRALQTATYTDPQGNKVRSRHALRDYVGEQFVLPGIVYIDPRTAKPDMMEKAFEQSWQGIVNDVRRHAIEKQSYDLNNPYSVQLRLFDYDFNRIAEDARMSGEYDDNYEDDDGLD
jgi:hypothetical protein